MSMKTNKTSPKKIVPPVAPLVKAKTVGIAKVNKPIEKQWNISDWKAKRMQNLKSWKKGQTGNPKWRKPKSFWLLIQQAKNLWYKQVTKEELREAFQALVGMDKDQIFKLANDPKQPWAIHLVATRFLSREWYDMLKDMLDRAHGTPTQSTNLSWEVGFTLADWLLNLERKKQKPEG